MGVSGSPPPPDTSCSTYICFNHSYISFCRLGLPCLTIVDHSRGAYRHPLPVCRILQQQPQHNSGPCLFSTCHLFYNRVQVWATVVLKLSRKCLQKVSGYKESCRISADCSDKNVKWWIWFYYGMENKKKNHHTHTPHVAPKTRKLKLEVILLH